MYKVNQFAVGCASIAASAIGAAVLAGDLPVQGRPVPSLSIFDDAMQSYMDFYGINAGVLAVSVDGRVVYQKGFGTNIAENTPMRLASVEKPITAAAIQHLIANGQLDLDDNAFDLDQFGGGILDIQPYNGVLGDEWLKYITIEDLLNHQGGWDSGTGPIGDPQFETLHIANVLGVPSPADPDQIISYMLAQPVDYVPGTNGCETDDGDPFYCYSNFGYMVLGRIVEEVSGMSLLQYFRTRILTPAMDVPNQEVVFGRTKDSANYWREPYYQCNACSVTDVFFPNGSPVENPYGGWHHEAFMGHGNLVASAMPLMAFMDRYQVGVLNGAGVPLDPGDHGGGTFNGGIDGISTCIMQRNDDINIVVLLSRRQGSEYANEVANTISSLINLTEPDWPDQTSDGFWTEFGGVPSAFDVGGYHNPFHTMQQALGVGPGAKIRLKPGSTNWTGTISHRMSMDSPLPGSTVIGVQ